MSFVFFMFIKISLIHNPYLLPNLNYAWRLCQGRKVKEPLHLPKRDVSGCNHTCRLSWGTAQFNTWREKRQTCRLFHLGKSLSHSGSLLLLPEGYLFHGCMLFPIPRVALVLTPPGRMPPQHEHFYSSLLKAEWDLFGLWHNIKFIDHEWVWNQLDSWYSKMGYQSNLLNKWNGMEGMEWNEMEQEKIY